MLVSVADGLDEQVPEGPVLKFQFAQDVEDLSAQGFSGFLQFLQQPVIYVSLAGFVGHEIPQVTGAGLADTVDPAEPLLDPVGVPGQVVIDHEVGPLEVDAFPRRVRGDQQPGPEIIQKALLDLLALFAAHPPGW